MKSVLISIKPKWCELIASGKKTVEVRKSKPKLETPFKVYIYATEPRSKKDLGLCLDNGKVGLVYRWNYDYARKHKMPILSGKVIGEFVCDKIIRIQYSCGSYRCEGLNRLENDRIASASQLSLYDMRNYLSCNDGYGWHISDLVIYDKPKELSEFVTALSDKDIRCKHIQMRYTINGIRYFKCTLQNSVCEFRRLGHQTDCDGYEMLNPSKPITRPPQSWCYVEEVSDEQREAD